MDRATELLHVILIRKRRAHYDRAVAAGIIDRSQADQLMALFLRDLEEHNAPEAAKLAADQAEVVRPLAVDVTRDPTDDTPPPWSRA